PAQYQTASPSMQASNATENTSDTENFPSAANAPASIIVGTAGNGTPSCSSSTLANISNSPYCVISNTSSCIIGYTLAASLFSRQEIRQAPSMPKWYII